MNRSTKRTYALWALMVLNVVLGMALLARHGSENTAVAQVGRPADYLIVPGAVVSSTDAVMYMLDMSNGVLGAMAFDSPSSQFSFLQPIDLNRLFDEAQRTGGAAAPQTGRAPRR
jgi:hypothetical protein